MFSRLKPVMIAIALIGFAMPSTRGLAEVSSSVIEQERRVERGSRIVIRNEFGDIRIAGSDRTTMEAVATDLNGSQAVPVNIVEGSSDNKRVLTVSPIANGRGIKPQINLEVKVPRYVELERIYIRVGKISISDLDGGVSHRTEDGNISVHRVGSPGGGLIDVTTWSGNVDLSNIKGDVRIVAFSSTITVQCVKGDVAARVASGQIAVSNIGGDVELNNSSGSLSFRGSINSQSRYRLKTLSGDAYMDIPDTVGFTAALSAYSGQIHTDFQFPHGSRTPPGTTNQFIIGRYGDGSGRIQLDSFSGGVFLRKIAASTGPDCQR